MGSSAGAAEAAAIERSLRALGAPERASYEKGN